MTTDPNRHHTRAATRAGVFPAPTLPRDTPPTTSSPHPSTRALGGATGSPKTRPVTPDLLYSVVASAVSLARGVSPAALEGQGDGPGNASANVLTELPSLTRDVDFGPVVTPVSIATHANNPHVVPYDSKIIDGHVDGDVDASHLAPNSRSPSTVARATLEMSREELVTLARRYEAMAREAMAEANHVYRPYH
ncbi:hypothetical protein B0H13DRAFT_1893287 [Mycena leptocephala]|nr:hypothetical protein B0H13DRAFT_1893287 [Mycena leptocephala]